MFIYLVGFIVTDFQNQTIEDHRDLININLGLWGREKVVNSRFGQGSVEITAGFLHTLKANLNMKYLLPKLDVVAIPNYPVPAMEDWGLLIWQEQHWKQITRPSIGSDILGIMADQTVNQVFGNVVTIKSWSDMWLIQGFSAYLSATVVDSTMEGYEWLFSEITDNIVHVINFDSMQNVKAVRFFLRYTVSTAW